MRNNENIPQINKIMVRSYRTLQSLHCYHTVLLVLSCVFPLAQALSTCCSLCLEPHLPQPSQWSSSQSSNSPSLPASTAKGSPHIPHSYLDLSLWTPLFRVWLCMGVTIWGVSDSDWGGGVTACWAPSLESLTDEGTWRAAEWMNGLS